MCGRKTPSTLSLGQTGLVPAQRQRRRAGDQGRGGLDQHRGRRPDANRQGARRTCRTPTADLRANTFGTGRIVLREEPKADRRAERSGPLGRRLPRRLRARQGLSRATARPSSFTSARCGWACKDGDTTEIIAGLAAGRSDRQQEQRRAGSAAAQEQSGRGLRAAARRRTK